MSDRRHPHRNGPRPVLVVHEAQRATPDVLVGATRRIPELDAGLARDIADGHA